MSKIVIGCKMPSGILLQTGQPGDPGYRELHLKGANQGEIREGGLFVAHTMGGFGRTEVDAAFWAAYSEGKDIVGEETTDPRTGTVLMTAERSRTALVKARKALIDEWQAKDLVFVVATPDLAAATAQDKAAVKTGFEPLARAGDARAKSAGAGIVTAAA